MKKLLLGVLLAGLVLSPMVSEAADEVLFSFEEGMDGWDIPDWAYEKPDHVQREINMSDKVASNGKKSLEMMTEFPGGSWAGAIIEVMQYMDWTDYTELACDIYLPEGAPEGLKGKMILTVGDTWKWVEMSRDFALVPGEWVKVSASLAPGSIDWRKVQVDDAFRKDVRKIDIRVTSNGKPAYKGPVYIDNIRVSKP
ncbi:MAG: hypothetical protein HQL30_08970 [Candidatus Omnitrophica bacterium]|nr:hypothetical protein [Candidatus Omnitrophota bacterium]